MTLADETLQGSRRALSRLLTQVENGEEGSAEAIAALYPHTGRASLVGVTGAPGTGKSSLVNQLAMHLRRAGKTIAILAVDPTSPFSGGAILGDRIRMRDLSGDPGVFIRSMATRGSLGGLARATAGALKVLDAAGFDIILIETVGAGQSEVDIALHAHTVIVVEAPGLGDDVQAIKAGILEIADILVVNKSDDPRAPNTLRALQAMLDLGDAGRSHALIDHHGRIMHAMGSDIRQDSSTDDSWRTPIVSTVAVEDKGLDELVEAMARHRAFLTRSGEMARRQSAQVAAEVDSLLGNMLMERLLGEIDRGQIGALIARVVARQLDPQSAASELLKVRG